MAVEPSQLADSVFAAIKRQEEAEVLRLLIPLLDEPVASSENSEGTQERTESKIQRESLSVAKEAIREFRDKDEFSLLHWSAMGGQNEVVLLLLRDFNIEVDIRGQNLQTPLMWAAMDERLLTMHILLDHGADIQAKDDLADNSLTLAAQHEKLMSCLFLLHLGIDVNNTNVTGSSAAHWAAFCGAYMLLAVLLIFGANMHTSYDHYGLLPIHRALQLEYYATAKLLVDLDKSLLDVKTKDGLNLEEFADKSELSRRWFSDFINLCRNPDYQVSHGPADKKLMGAENEDEKDSTSCPMIMNFRQMVWSKFVDVLIKMENSNVGKAFIPVLALFFATVFVLAWRSRLGAVNALVIEYLTKLFATWTTLSIPIFHWLLSCPPQLGLVSIVAFVLLLRMNPGYYPRDNDKKKLFQEIQGCLANVEFVCKSTGINTNGTAERPKGDYVRLAEWLEKKQAKLSEVAVQDKNLLARINVNRICPTCWILKDLRTKHCSICNACCTQMDHHCLWINKCVGRHNHRVFAIFTFCAGIAQFHQIGLLTLYLLTAILCKIFRWNCHPTLSLNLSPWDAFVCAAAATIHFITYSWSAQLLSSQMKGIWEGVFINEVLSFNKYKHFICDIEYKYSDEKILYMQELLRKEESLSEEQSSNEHGLNLSQRQGQSTKIVPSEIPNQSEIVPKTPAIKNSIDSTIVRHFIRNPFALDNSVGEFAGTKYSDFAIPGLAELFRVLDR
eukprot:Gregarina_sp_Poly_1__4062@NODE_2230_length_2440_cov_24_991150_g1433_i0_p1_GENE_NODE_2230_length_2440_cov_24_991150_g1433_i0NODE_2230_length_2440_cov_24_991150_g1433_i0_p1_ORF_typecomplete_len729_score88_95DHHC/PF01529_20/2_8e03DHHC/PF01529_20/2_3e03DHHC/PF01529_20/9e23Ank_2/PF12796_7/4_8e11Ank_2/PF12796_7/2_4e07Ank_5/PF13857_6/0_037Ank_5/PF13857_6/3_3e07Ank_5/PF13857_6/0_00014Ank_5/PF13857_6/41Ank_4/PF13637_6/0_99Ank_4/PF13637_6/0_00017Ank_4/PF13637_6/6_1e07Ank_4/PF13637_6/0_00021Ank_4/PF13637_6